MMQEDVYAKRRLPIIRDTLERPRITKLMTEGIQNALFTITAPSGYGKTQEAAAYFRRAPVRLIWMRLTKLDNLPAHFWDNFLACCQEEFPHLATKLKQGGFPFSLAQLDAFVRALAIEVYSGPATAFVVDEYSLLNNRNVRVLFELLVESSLENFSLVLIGRKNTSIDMLGLKSGGGMAALTGEELLFTGDEIHMLFQQHGVQLAPGELADILERTEGWPLVLYLLSRQYAPQGRVVGTLNEGDADLLTRLFDLECFSLYREELQHTLVKLALPIHFTGEVVRRVCGACAADVLDMLAHNQFVVHDRENDRYALHNMYRDFLARKQGGLTEEEKWHVHSAAGDEALAAGEELQAIEYFSLCGRHEDMMAAILQYLGVYMAASTANIGYLMEKLEGLPEDMAAENHMVGYVKASLCIQTFQLDKALDILGNMERRLLAEGTPKAKKMLGEVYERMAGVYMMMSRECSIDYYLKAADYVPDGSSFRPRSMPRVMNYSIFSIEGNAPGAIQSMESKLERAMPAILRVENGAMAGFHSLFAAEAALCTYDFARASQMAQKAIYEARPAEQHDFVCNACMVLAQVEKMKGDYPAMKGYVNDLVAYIDEVRMPYLSDSREYAVCWLRLNMGDLDNVPNWILAAEAGLGTKAPVLISREETLCGVYLMMRGKYIQAAAFLEHISELFSYKGWGDRISIYIMLATCYLQLQDEPRAMDALWTAYDMTHQNGIITPFVEQAQYTRTLLSHARATKRHTFDKRWLDDVSRKTVVYNKRLIQMKAEYHRETYRDVAGVPKLSKREGEVLASLADGLTRDEIADDLQISVNTVKANITNIYNKLGAFNRVDALRIARGAGLVQN